MEIARSFEEMSYLVMKERLAISPESALTSLDILQGALETSLPISIHSSFEFGSKDYARVLASCLRRGSAKNDVANEELSCIFMSASGESSGPWYLVTKPLPGESYRSFRLRIRGTGTSESSGKRKKSAIEAELRDPLLNLGDLCLTLPPGHRSGHPDLEVRFYANGVLFFLNGVVHRLDGPAVMNWDNSIMLFMKSGQRHRDAAPALLTAEGEDTFYDYGEEVCDISDIKGQGDDPDNNPRHAENMREILARYESNHGMKMDMDSRRKLKAGLYLGFSSFEEELYHLKSVMDENLAEAD